MTKDQLKYLLRILDRVKPDDEHIKKARAYVLKDLAQYDARKGQMRDNYDYEHTSIY